jgi:ribonuclease HI
MARVNRITDYFNRRKDVPTHHKNQKTFIQNLTILQTNVQSLNALKADMLSAISDEHDVHVIMVSELGHRRTIKGFVCAASSDCYTQSGIFVRSDVQFIKFHHKFLDFDSPRIGVQSILIQNNQAPHILAIHLYIPPDAQKELRLQVWSNLARLTRLFPEIPILLLGDVNTHSCVFDDSIAFTVNSYLTDLINDNWSVHNNAPTRDTAFLDICLSNDYANQHITCWKTLSEDLSDHLPALTNTMFQINVRRDKAKTVLILDKKRTLAKAHKLLAGLPLPWQMDHIHNAFQEAITYRKQHIKVSSFWNPELSRAKTLRNKAKKLRNLSPAMQQIYQNRDKEFKKLFQRTMKLHMRAVITEAANNPNSAEIWSIAKSLQPQLRGKKTKVWSTHSTLAQKEADKIGQLFENHSNADGLQPTAAEIANHNRLMQLHMQNLQHLPISVGEIHRAFQTMNRKGSSGEDRISPKLLGFFLKDSRCFSAICIGFNKVIQTGDIPSTFKTAKVRPLSKAKKGDFRPISLLSTMSKLLEKIVTARIRTQVSDKLTAQQFGCRSGHSVQQALTRVIHSSGIAAGAQSNFAMLAFDFTKAYDRVSRLGLIAKLSTLGLPSQLVLFANNWLQDRTFKVAYRGCISKKFRLHHGIPQGSALSVILWLLYINDLGQLLAKERSNLFVDDTLLWAYHNSIRETYAQLREQANIVLQWAKNNHVEINWGKTHLLHNNSEWLDVPFRIDHNLQLQPETNLLYLGVTFQHTFNSPVIMIDLQSPAQNIRRRASIIKRLRQYHFPANIMRQFVSAFCLGKLRFFTPFLGAEVNNSSALDPLIKAMNSCIRTELDAVISTPIPLLYAGSHRPNIKQMIIRDSSKLILSSIANNTILGSEFLEYQGELDGWTPLGTAWNQFDTLHIDPTLLLQRSDLSITERDSLFKMKFFYRYNREEALIKHQKNNLILPADIALWTDGSFQYNLSLAASAAMIYDENDILIEQVMCRFTTAGSSYEPELHALLLGLLKILQRQPRNKQIRIYTDSKSVISQLFAAGLRYSREEINFTELAHIIKVLSEHNKLSLHWIPGHANIPLNEAADEVAKDALLNAQTSQLPTRLSTYASRLTRYMDKTTRRSTNDAIKPSHFQDSPDRKHFSKLKNADLHFGPIFRLRTGHTRCMAHLYRLGIVSNDTCRLCHHTSETIDHLFLVCPYLSHSLEEFRQWVAEVPDLRRLKNLVWTDPIRLEKAAVKALRDGAVF